VSTAIHQVREKHNSVGGRLVVKSAKVTDTMNERSMSMNVPIAKHVIPLYVAELGRRNYTDELYERFSPYHNHVDE
jgi:hypothetical protein